MADIHIEEFYKDCARILVQLYNAFPRKIMLYVEDIAGPDEPDEYGIHSPRHQSCFAAMLWLAEENYLRYTDVVRQEALDQATLTQRSFLLLSGVAEPLPDTAATSPLPPSVTEELHTRISSLRRVLAEGSSTETARLMRTFFSL